MVAQGFRIDWNELSRAKSASRKRTSLGTTHEEEARQVIEARNNAERQPVLNLQIAKAYLAGTDNGIATRTWQGAIDSLIATKQEANQHRWGTAAKDKGFVPLLHRVIIETSGELLLSVMQAGTVSTNVYLRRLHNFCVDMNWLPWPLIAQANAPFRQPSFVSPGYEVEVQLGETDENHIIHTIEYWDIERKRYSQSKQDCILAVNALINVFCEKSRANICPPCFVQIFQPPLFTAGSNSRTVLHS